MQCDDAFCQFLDGAWRVGSMNHCVAVRTYRPQVPHGVDRILATNGRKWHYVMYMNEVASTFSIGCLEVESAYGTPVAIVFNAGLPRQRAALICINRYLQPGTFDRGLGYIIRVNDLERHAARFLPCGRDSCFRELPVPAICFGQPTTLPESVTGPLNSVVSDWRAISVATNVVSGNDSISRTQSERLGQGPVGIACSHFVVAPAALEDQAKQWQDKFGISGEVQWELQFSLPLTFGRLGFKQAGCVVEAVSKNSSGIVDAANANSDLARGISLRHHPSRQEPVESYFADPITRFPVVEKQIGLVDNEPVGPSMTDHILNRSL